MARYAGPIIAPALAFGLGLVLPLGQKKAYYGLLANFRPFLMSSSYLGNLLVATSETKKIQKVHKKSKKIQKKYKKPKQKSKKSIFF